MSAKTPKPPKAPIPCVTLQVPGDAARAMRVSSEYFNRYVRREIKITRRGGLELTTPAELERWFCENAGRVFDA